MFALAQSLMRFDLRWLRLPFSFLPLVFSLEGCGVELVPTLFGIGAGTASGTGVSYTIDNIAYKTFNVPVDEVEQGARGVLAKMEFPIVTVERDTAGVSLLAKSANAAHELDIEIDLERLSPQVTRMRVVAKRGFFLKDSSTATEIILQTVKGLESHEKAEANSGNGAPTTVVP
jgi:hypothetical protein